MKTDDIQKAVAERIKQIPRLNKAGLDVLTENKEDLIAAIDASLAKLGLVAIVGTPTGKAKSTDSESIEIDGTVVVTLTENVQLNRTRSGSLPIGTATELLAVYLNLKTVTEKKDTLVFQSWSSPVVLDGNIVIEITFGCQYYLEPEPETLTE